MKRNLLFILVVSLFQIGTGIAVNAQELSVSDVQNSGCLNRTRADEDESREMIVLLKEGSSMTVKLLNYVCDCGTSDFDVIPSMSGGSDGTPFSLSISVEPIVYADADCICPYNVSFTIQGLESNSFLFSCWWCEGMVTLTDGEPLVLENVWEDASIDGLDYKIHKVMHSAQLTGGKSWAGEQNIPSEVVYEGQKYIVTSIGYNAFADNTALTSISIPNSVISIDDAAFIRCTGLTSIVIPKSVRSLGYNVFLGCTNLASITIPNSVTRIGSSAFNGTPWYNNQPDGVVYAGGIAYTYKGTMPEGTQIDIKEGTIAIANNIFSRCDNLASLTIPGSVSTIGSHAFMRCNNLTTVIISEGVKRIEDGAFMYCSSLKSIVIPQSVTRIGQYAFMECTALTFATINGAITRMGRWAFAGCTALYSLSISQNVKDLGYASFCNCTSLYRVKIPGSVTRIGEEVFYRCSNLYSVQIFEGVEAIGYSAFGECNNISYVILPNSLTKIDNYAFYNCSKLNEVICYANNVPTTASNVFYNSNFASATLHVPAGSVDKYKETEPWNEFGNIVGMDYYYYQGKKIPLILNENKVVISIPKEYDEIVNRIRANVQILYTIKDDRYDIFVITRSYFEKLTTMDSWEEDAKFVILTPCYYTENGYTVFASPYLNVRLKDEKDIDLLNSYVEKYRLVITGKSSFLPWYILSITPESGKNSVECANELYETGCFASSVADLVDGPNEPIVPPVTFTMGQMATIILPTVPDANKGKYYRLDKCENGKIIFEQEKQPQPHIPYIIVPSEDFSIDTGTLDLAGLSPDTVSIAGIDFIGSYSHKELNEQEGWYIDIIDTTPDCGFASSGETGKGAFIGALRAYLTVNWDDPINHDGSKGPGDKLEIVLKDNPNSLTPTLSKGEGDEIVNGKWSNGKWFDLSGRRLFGKPARGIYIEDGKKKAQ